ncbi:HD domain-containing protein [Ginsengibacter hankyongi]|uniref:HD domain-containing protein n=1 Tax=Ginsengibacter hankyongi TaxID=2607284 RepID=A0A5J5INS3_9BACT|nr:HD domain-containing protein [Ginsengibacter hankyongi]KAA9041574.1 HD domain-containing protein [Ginsengibacter hankyongi]
MAYRKIINDPVYGFITVDDELVYTIISHPYYQRLRRIHQMAMAQLVYPGAVHTRLHHSLGAYHLMCNAIKELKGKGFSISAEEEQAAKIAILLHDIGHGPYSHALEQVLIKNVSHEKISLMLMEKMNAELSGKLEMAIDIFKDDYPKKFLHQLVSGQLDVDRMDYLIRDSFFTGVSEGVIGYDRIIKMLTVHDGELMIEEKGIYSIEKFLVSRRLMYWQVYLHKTVLCAEKMLVNIIKRARIVNAQALSGAFNNFLHKEFKEEEIENHLDDFCMVDDYDVLSAIKSWALHPDKILSVLCKGIINRRLLKIKYSGTIIDDNVVKEKTELAIQYFKISNDEARYLVFTGETGNKTYSNKDEHINILFKDGTIKDISEVDNALINQTLFGTVKKFYICFPNMELL